MLMRAAVEKLVNRLWYGGRHPAWLLAPLALCYCLLARLRRYGYRRGLLSAPALGVPVIVVGNLTAGGSGKTPLVIWLAEFLREAGYRVGIIARGYGGAAGHRPRPVGNDSDPLQVGDEALLLARRTGCPVWIGSDRVAAAHALLQQHDCDLLLSDDGLQHYRLRRALEIAVIDGERRFGNGLCLPAGPLREPLSRLDSVDFTVIHGDEEAGCWRMQLSLSVATPLAGGEGVPVELFRGRRVHAVAGIGYPPRFFAALRARGIEVLEHPHADHALLRPADLCFGDGMPVLMTEKDAVKCDQFGIDDAWSVAAQTRISPGFGDALLARLR